MRLAAVSVLALGLAAAVLGARAAFPGGDGRVVYAARIGPMGGLLDARRRRRRPQADEQPDRRLGARLVAEGDRIVFRSERTGNPEIFVMNANGKQVKQLTRRALPDTRPAWSPDGKRIVFQRFQEGGPTSCRCSPRSQS